MAVKLERKKGKGKVSKKSRDGTTDTREDTFSPVTGHNLATVSYGLGATKNMGNYESAKIDVRVELPCENNKKSIRKTFKRAEAYCEDKLAAALAELDGID